jgi:bifunctional non-homologous end joining protein LigD
MPLDEYRRKRRRERTPEPFGEREVAAVPHAGGIFVVQKHQARALHYDFRLEMDGVLRSWAVPKGPSMNPRDRRLAVMVEDHPLEYADFEGRIPEGEYGAGAVIVWDRGEYQMVDPADAGEGVRRGGFEFELRGEKLRGGFVLIRTRGMRGAPADRRQQWLLIKRRDRFASERDVAATRPRSVISRLTLEQMQRGGRSGSKRRSHSARLR